MLTAPIAALLLVHLGPTMILLWVTALCFALGMARYGAEMNRTASTTLPVGSVTADTTTPRRTKIFYLSFGSEATPADFAFKWTVKQVTAPGTSTAVTATPLDFADAATTADVGENHTLDTTDGATEILSTPLNQRSTFQWYAPPGGDVVGPATTGDGHVIRTPTAGNLVAVTATAHFTEE